MNDTLRYSPKHIISILDTYSAVSLGDFDSDQTHSFSNKVNKDVYRAPFENSIVAKADIDIACGSLGRPGAWSSWCYDIEQPPAGHNLNPKQMRIAKYIRGDDTQIIRGIVKELSLIA